MKKILIVLVIFYSSVHCKRDSTQIARFSMPQHELKSSQKEFVNDTKYHIQLRYSVQDPETGKVYTQEPIIHRGERRMIDFFDAASHFSPNATLNVTLDILRVRQLAKGAGLPLIAIKFKDGNLAFQISGSKFRQHKVFEFYLNKNGLLMHKAH